MNSRPSRSLRCDADIDTRREMSDTEPQTASGKVLWHFLMSLDGFVAGPNHEMDWMSGVSVRPGLHDEYIETTGAVLGGRDGWNVVNEHRPYGGAWKGPSFVLTHHPEDALHVAPILLGEGIRLYDNPGSDPIPPHRVHEGAPALAINARYRPATRRPS